MPQQKKPLIKKNKSLYYKFYFLPLLILLLAVAYFFFLGAKGLKAGRYTVLAWRKYIFDPFRSIYQKHRLYLRTKFSLLRL